MDNDTTAPEVWILGDALRRMFPRETDGQPPKDWAELLIDELRKRGVLVLMRMD